ncbi:hypothetical protein [Virgibacillus chiguensis]|uniref:Uncharacterized protein n=1 Tax=Virgibacillus chiguensis TaxID=411959 RepID=A0A1M5VD14_9BACI|nr:hypothetical protein [Virgibacillus chiguensis]SHH73172.1 hypothetical protein SAMN05421807_11254 [Virgibacillus chiguensis]
MLLSRKQFINAFVPDVSVQKYHHAPITAEVKSTANKRLWGL